MKTIIIALSLTMLQLGIFFPLANATCLETCGVQLFDDDCNIVKTFKSHSNINILGTCSVSCCTPPNLFSEGACSSYNSVWTPSRLSILDANDKTMPVSFFKNDLFCENKALLSADRYLKLGHYQLVSTGSNSVPFEVIPTNVNSTALISISTIVLLVLFL